MKDASSKDSEVYLLSFHCRKYFFFSIWLWHSRNGYHGCRFRCCCYKDVIVFRNMRIEWKQKRERRSCLHSVPTWFDVNWSQQSNCANVSWQTWSDGISGHNKSWNVPRPLVSVWTIKQLHLYGQWASLWESKDVQGERGKPANRNKDGGVGAHDRNVEVLKWKK